MRQYSSHVTGIVSAIADNLALGDLPLVFTGLAAVVSFLLGAMCTASMVLWARRRVLESEYALPLVVEASLLVIFGLTGRVFEGRSVLSTICLLSFTMGLQNAIITKISRAEIRTTHVTGMVTDIGIELGKLLYWNRSPIGGSEVRAERRKLWLLSSLVGLFFIGGVVGALGFRHIGFISTVPLAFVLVILAAVPVLDDLRKRA